MNNFIPLAVLLVIVSSFGFESSVFAQYLGGNFSHGTVITDCYEPDCIRIGTGLTGIDNVPDYIVPIIVIGISFLGFLAFFMFRKRK